MGRSFRELIYHLVDSRRKARENFSDINCFRRFRQDDLPTARRAAHRRPMLFQHYSSFLELVNRYLNGAAKNSPGPLVPNTGKKPTTLWNSVYKAFATVYKVIVLNKNLRGGCAMADKVGVALLVGAGDAIGAAVARRIAEGGSNGFHAPGAGGQRRELGAGVTAERRPV